MKKNLLITLLPLLLLSLVWMSHNVGEAKAVGKDRTGSPISDGTCGKSNCHTGGNYNTKTVISIADAMGNPVTKYKANTTYEMKVTVSGTGQKGFGFQMVALNATNSNAGVFSNSPVAQIIKLNNIDYIEQPNQNTSGLWKFSWTSPAKGSGLVKFYACGLACDDSKSVQGDQAVATTLSLEETTATYEIAKSFSVKLQNITRNTLDIEFSGNNTGVYQMEIVDLTGKVLKVDKRNIESGISSIQLPLSNFQQGIYLLHITKNDGDSLTKKFIVN